MGAGSVASTSGSGSGSAGGTSSTGALATGGGGLISDDGWTWRGGAVRPGGGAAPDVIKIGDRYLIDVETVAEAPPEDAAEATPAS